jgi:hypothetical protein
MPGAETFLASGIGDGPFELTARAWVAAGIVPGR